MRNVFAIITVWCLCAGYTAHGGIISVSAPESGWAESAWEISDEYRWGATARNVKSSADTWEVGIGNTTAMTESTPATEEHLDWGAAGTEHAFVLDYDHTAGLATWTIDDAYSVALNPETPFSDMYIQLKSRPDGSSTSITNTTFTLGAGEIGIAAFSATGETSDSKLQYVHINTSAGQLSDMDFILEGTLVFDWTGAVPSGEEDMGMHVKLIQIPEPASVFMIVLVSVSGLFIRRRFR